MWLHFDLVNDLYVRTKYNTIQPWPIQNSSAITPLVCMKSYSVLSLGVIPLFSLLFAFKSASCLEDTMWILYL
jgi:hypothetical protein